MQTLRLGQTILVAGMTLALLILPIIIVATREALRSIPLEIREAAYRRLAPTNGRRYGCICCRRHVPAS